MACKICASTYAPILPKLITKLKKLPKPIIIPPTNTKHKTSVVVVTLKTPFVKINGYAIPSIIRYTLDGTEPTTNSSIYTSALPVTAENAGTNQNIIVKAKSFVMQSQNMPLISSQTTKASYRLSTALPQNKGKHKQKKPCLRLK